MDSCYWLGSYARPADDCRRGAAKPVPRFRDNFPNFLAVNAALGNLAETRFCSSTLIGFVRPSLSSCSNVVHSHSPLLLHTDHQTKRLFDLLYCIQRRLLISTITCYLGDNGIYSRRRILFLYYSSNSLIPRHTLRFRWDHHRLYRCDCEALAQVRELCPSGSHYPTRPGEYSTKRLVTDWAGSLA